MKTLSQPRSQAKANLPALSGLMLCACGPFWRLGLALDGGTLQMGRGCFAERSVRLDGNRRHVAASVVGHHEHLARRVHAHVAGATSFGGGAVEQRQLSGALVNGEAAHASFVARAFRNRIKELLRRRDRHEARALRLRRERERAQLSRSLSRIPRRRCPCSGSWRSCRCRSRRADHLRRGVSGQEWR